ncbi:MAG: hypothetical protein ACRYGP_17710 [Janthinobacterium lividum]
MTKTSPAALIVIAVLSLCAATEQAGASARRGGHFVGGYGPHHRGAHEVGGHRPLHPIRALLRRL